MYSLPETASTAGLMYNQLKAMGVNAMLGYIAKEAPVWAIGGSGKLLQGVGRFAMTGGGRYAMEATAVTAGIDAAKKSREKETALEAIQAVSERVSTDVQRNGGDMQKITNAVLTAANRMGIDASDFGVDDIIKFGVAYNIETGDAAFDTAKRDARKGLSKLINSNNALAIVDYL